jgi:thiol reductant ABC exporter CydC subunit
MRGQRTQQLITLARPGPGELRRLTLCVALAGGAALAAIALLGTSGYLISRAAERPPILGLMVAIVAVRAFGLTRAVLRYGERLASHDLALRQLGRLRQHFYRSLVPLVPAGLSNRSGDLLSRFVADIDTLKDLYLRVLIPGLVSLLVLIAATLAAWLMLPTAGLTVFLSLTLAILLLPWLSGTVASRAARRQAPARSRLTSELIESIDGARELALSGGAPAHAERFTATDNRLARIARSDALASSAAAAAGGMLAGVGVLALLIVAIPAVHSGALSGVLLAALIFLMLAAYDSILPLSAAARSLRVCATAAERLQEIALVPAPVTNPISPRSLTGNGDLCAEHLGFGYETDQPLVLDDLELRIAPREHVALTGPSGIGKSTLADLLVRFNDPTQGRLTLDGIDLRELSQRQVRAAVVLCAQDCHVFNTTIRENLLIGRRDATEAQILDVLETVELADWATGLPHGLDTVMGQDGELASGGQRQRIALARALLSEARFLILDEPTAHLDAKLAQRVMRNILNRSSERGMLLITHDPSLSGLCQRTVALEHSLGSPVCA